MSTSLLQRLRFLPSPKTTVNWLFSLQLALVSMADKTARCPASANSTGATIVTLRPLCCRSIVGNVYACNVLLAFLTDICARLSPFSVSFSTILCLIHPLSLPVSLTPAGRFTLPRIFIPLSQPRFCYSCFPLPVFASISPLFFSRPVVFFFFLSLVPPSGFFYADCLGPP